jgi:RNA 2',3'-cyclic 3'-phosphodiesterase
MNRLYFALWPNEATRLQLSQCCPQLIRDAGGQALFPPTLHMTLAYLGDVETKLLPVIEKIATSLTGKPFDYTANFAGCFAKARAAWLGTTAVPDELLALQKRLQTLLAAAQLDQDKRSFRPYLTVARDIGTPFADRAVAPVQWHIDHFCLVATRAGAAGPVADVLKSWPLKD